MTLWVNALKYWLYCFDLEIIYYNSHKNWRLAINPKQEQEKNNWYISNINKYGSNNKQFLFKMIGFISLIQSIIILIYSLFVTNLTSVNRDDTIHNDRFDATVLINILFWLILVFVNYMIPLVVSLYFVWKLRIRDNEMGVFRTDSLGIRHELLVTTSLIVITICVTMIACVASVIASKSGDYDTRFIIGQMLGWMVCLLSVAHVWFHTLYPKYLFDSLNKSKNNLKSKLSIVCGKFNDNNSDNIKLERLICNKPWRDIVTIYAGYEALMSFLETEFSIENLLFIQEVW